MVQPHQDGFLVDTRPLNRIVGVSAWTRQISDEILCVSGHDSSVVISGPTGTGKELIARAIHAHSLRADRPFVALNCSAIATNLFESHMFGHVKGAFTGAHYAAVGCFRAAEGGTIFLDEITELDIDLQAKLLRVLQENEVVPVGSHQGVPVDIRVIAATNRDFRAEVVAGRFREDLYYRLNVVSLTTLPLKDRPEDIEPLTVHCLVKLAERNGFPLKELSAGAVELLRSHDWPGNVRELENVLERAAVFSTDDVIGVELLMKPLVSTGLLQEAAAERRLPQPTQHDLLRVAPTESVCHDAEAVCREARSDQSQTGQTSWLSLAELEKYHLRTTLEHTGYNQAAAARLLGVSARVLARKIRKHGIDVPGSRCEWRLKPPVDATERPAPADRPS